MSIENSEDCKHDRIEIIDLPPGGVAERFKGGFQIDTLSISDSWSPGFIRLSASKFVNPISENFAPSLVKYQLLSSYRHLFDHFKLNSNQMIVLNHHKEDFRFYSGSVSFRKIAFRNFKIF